MQKMRTIFLCGLAIFISTALNAQPANTTAPSFNYIFQQSADGYMCYRIPALLQTSAGTLLAFAEARKYSCKDEGRIDLVVRRSTDKGATWGPLIIVWSDSANTCGNPVPVLDRKTGNILLLMTWNLATDALKDFNNKTAKDTRRVYITRSTDDGLHWQAPKEITAGVKPSSWGWYATGPCHGIQVSAGKYKGRIVIPCDYVEAGDKISHSHVIWSDDGGTHWKLGGIVDLPNVNECSVAELPGGSLLLSMRNKPYRRMARSKDGGASWIVDPVDTVLADPACQGSLLSSPARSHKELFFSNPSATTRTNMTIRLSEDDGLHWPRSYQLYTGPSAYSDLVMPDDSHIGILYEAGIAKPYEGIVFTSIEIAAIK